MNSINPAPIDSDTGSTRISQPDKPGPVDTPAPIASKTEKVVPTAWRFTLWTRGWIPGAWDGPF